jgi:biotin-(acetyl-CoA carboxylase) ligase
MSTGFPVGGAETVERFGRPFRHFPVAVSSEAMAMAWANKEEAPAGALVVVDAEVGARGFHGRVWGVAAADSLACSMVLRPALSVEEGNATWLVAGLAAAKAAEATMGTEMSTWWPDSVMRAGTRDEVAAVRAEVQLGPGKVKSAVVTLRFDLPALGLSRERKDELLEAAVNAVDEVAGELEEGSAAVAAAYEKRCAVLDNRVRVELRPKGETRGVAKRITRTALLEIQSASGMMERIGIDQLRTLHVL